MHQSFTNIQRSRSCTDLTGGCCSLRRDPHLLQSRGQQDILQPASLREAVTNAFPLRWLPWLIDTPPRLHKIFYVQKTDWASIFRSEACSTWSCSLTRTRTVGFQRESSRMSMSWVAILIRFVPPYFLWQELFKSWCIIKETAPSTFLIFTQTNSTAKIYSSKLLQHHNQCNSCNKQTLERKFQEKCEGNNAIWKYLRAQMPSWYVPRAKTQTNKLMQQLSATRMSLLALADWEVKAFKCRSNIWESGLFLGQILILTPDEFRHLQRRWVSLFPDFRRFFTSTSTMWSRPLRSSVCPPRSLQMSSFHGGPKTSKRDPK